MRSVKRVKCAAQRERPRYRLDRIEMAASTADYQRSVIVQASREGLSYSDAFNLPGAEFLRRPRLTTKRRVVTAISVVDRLIQVPIKPCPAKNKPGHSERSGNSKTEQKSANDCHGWGGIDNPVQVGYAQHSLIGNKRAFDVFHHHFSASCEQHHYVKTVSKGLLFQ